MVWASHIVDTSENAAIAAVHRKTEDPPQKEHDRDREKLGEEPPTCHLITGEPLRPEEEEGKKSTTGALFFSDAWQLCAFLSARSPLARLTCTEIDRPPQSSQLPGGSARFPLAPP